MAEWTHGICETCWFEREPERFPVQVKREADDLFCDHCCFCGTTKVTRIYVRHDPKDSSLFCGGVHPELDDAEDALSAPEGDVPESG